jgi:glucose/arabinose dehydrogenase
MSIYNSFILLFAVCILTLTIIMNNNNFPVTFAQIFQNKSTNSTMFIGCAKYEASFHCDGMHNNFSSYEVSSQSSQVYNSTDIPDFVKGKRGSALEMHANYLKSIIFPTTSTISPKQFSISFWIKGFSLPNNPSTPELGYIISQMNPNKTSGWAFNAINMQNLSKEAVQLTVYNNNGDAFSTPSVPIFKNNSFTHIVGTFDGSSIKIYKDGDFFGETQFNGIYNNKIDIPLRLGVAANSNMEFFWTGDIDDLQIFNMSLDMEQISKVFNNPNSKANIDSKNLIGFWRFNNDLNDTSGNNNHGQEITLISSMVFTPDGRLFFSQKDTGMVKVMKDEVVNTKPFAMISDHYSSWEQGLLGLALDPKYEQNHFIYLFYTYFDKESEKPFNRIIRFTDSNSIGTNKTIIFDKIPASNGFHSGGAMAFGSDEKLYVTIGDATENTRCGNLFNSTGYQCSAQNTSSLLGKVLRINKDGTIPTDNPYPGSPVYNIGHINMYGIAFDKNGFGLVSENGDELYDEINTIKKGGNYGAPTLQPFNTDPEFSSNFIKPLRSYYIAKCLTQLIYYDGDKIPQLKDKFLIGNINTGAFYAIQVDRAKQQIIEEEVVSLSDNFNNEIISLTQSPKGDIYYGAYSINKLDSVDINNKKQILFPIGINYSSSVVDINGLYFIPSENSIILKVDSKIKDIHNISKTINNSFSNSFLSIMIPKGLLNNITSVDTNFSNNDKNQLAPKSIIIKKQNISDSNQNKVNIILDKPGQYEISIHGNSLFN